MKHDVTATGLGGGYGRIAYLTPEQKALRVAKYRERLKTAPRCSGIRADGLPCKFPVDEPGGLCHFHSPLKRERLPWQERERKRAQITRDALRGRRTSAAERSSRRAHAMALIRLWAQEPWAPGRTIVLRDVHERRFRELLVSALPSLGIVEIERTIAPRDLNLLRWRYQHLVVWAMETKDSYGQTGEDAFRHLVQATVPRMAKKSGPCPEGWENTVNDAEPVYHYPTDETHRKRLPLLSKDERRANRAKTEAMQKDAGIDQLRETWIAKELKRREAAGIPPPTASNYRGSKRRHLAKAKAQAVVSQDIAHVVHSETKIARSESKSAGLREYPD